MKTRRIWVVGALSLVAALAGARRAQAITEPDLANTCTTANGNAGCFNVQNNFNTSTSTTTSSAVGTAITAVATGTGTAFKGFTSGTANGLLGVSTSSGIGVRGISTSGAGVNGSSTSSTGVTGTTTSSTAASGVLGSTTGNGQGVKGVVTGSGGTPFLGTNAVGVWGTSPRACGVYGEITVSVADQAGIVGVSKAPGSFSHGVMGVYGGGDNGVAGVFGRTWIPGQPASTLDPFSIGVYGLSGGAGVRGESHGLIGVQGFGQPGIGVSGLSYGHGGGDPNADPATTTSVGVVGHSGALTGTAVGVRGTIEPGADSASVAIYGSAIGSSATGIYGVSTNGGGVWGVSTTGSGIVAVTGATTTEGAAAVSAYPGSTSALAYFGEGGILLTGSLAEKTGGTSWSNPSDRRIKKDVQDLDRGLADLMRVRPVRFKYNGLGGTQDDGKEQVGVIAQELREVVPSMVHTRKAKLHKGDSKDTEIEIVDPSEFTYMLINAVKQQQRTIAKQEERIATLERGSAPLASSMFSGSLGGLAALALLPLGMILARRRQKQG